MIGDNDVCMFDLFKLTAFLFDVIDLLKLTGRPKIRCSPESIKRAIIPTFTKAKTHLHAVTEHEQIVTKMRKENMGNKHESHLEIFINRMPHVS